MAPAEPLLSRTQLGRLERAVTAAFNAALHALATPTFYGHDTSPRQARQTDIGLDSDANMTFPAPKRVQIDDKMHSVLDSISDLLHPKKN